MKAFKWDPLDYLDSEEKIQAMVELSKKEDSPGHQQIIFKAAEEARARIKVGSINTGFEYLSSEEAIQGYIDEARRTKGVPQEVIEKLLRKAETARARLVEKAS